MQPLPASQGLTCVSGPREREGRGEACGEGRKRGVGEGKGRGGEMGMERGMGGRVKGVERERGKVMLQEMPGGYSQGLI